MASENGKVNAVQVVMFVGAILGAGITVYSVFHAPLVQAIADEKTCRQNADDKLSDALTNAIITQQRTNESTNVLLTKIATKVEFIEAKVK